MLLAHLSLGESPEVLARQGLDYVLAEYPVLRAAAGDEPGDHWREFFAAALPMARDSRDERMLADLLQLRALYDRLRPDSFEPLPAGFFEDTALPRLLLQLERLPERIVHDAVRRGICSWWGNPTFELGENSVPVLLGRVGLYVSASRAWWARYGQSGLWLHTSFRYRVFAGFTEAEMKAVRESFGACAPAGRRLFGSADFGIPLLIPAGTGEDQVIDSCVDTLERLRAQLAGAGLATVAAPAKA